MSVMSKCQPRPENVAGCLCPARTARASPCSSLRTRMSRWTATTPRTSTRTAVRVWEDAPVPHMQTGDADLLGTRQSHSCLRQHDVANIQPEGQHAEQL